MNQSDFDFVTSELKRRSGIVIGPDKMYLLESRLSPIARKEGLDSIDELIGMVRRRRDEAMMKTIVDAMTTNETFFYRDKTPFDHLEQTILPALKESRPGLNIGRYRENNGAESPISINQSRIFHGDRDQPHHEESSRHYADIHKQNSCNFHWLFPYFPVETCSAVSILAMAFSMPFGSRARLARTSTAMRSVSISSIPCLMARRPTLAISSGFSFFPAT